MPKGVYKHYSHQALNLMKNGVSVNKGKKYSKKHRGKIALAKMGEKNPKWKGGRRIMTSNKGRKYIGIYNPTHPFTTKEGYVREHRLVMEEKLGRYLTREEIPHHIDGNILNNSPENLELFNNNSEHISYHNKLRYA